MVPASDKQGNDNASLNNNTGEPNQDACELSFEELEQISGGWIWVCQPGASIYSAAQFAYFGWLRTWDGCSRLRLHHCGTTRSTIHDLPAGPRRNANLFLGDN
jgi:bacteriocin-like protein